MNRRVFRCLKSFNRRECNHSIDGGPPAALHCRTNRCTIPTLIVLAGFIALWAVPAGAQPLEQVQAGYRLTRLVYENTLGEKGATDFSYDNDNRVCRGIWRLSDGSKSSVNIYQHDHRGLLVTTFREFSDSLTSLEVYSYDEQGNRIGERFCRSDRVRGTATYTYDQNARRIRARFTRHKGWLDADAVYVYDGQGLLRSAVLLNDVDTVGRVSYDYDSTGNLAHEIWTFAEGWTQTFTYEYTPTTCRLWGMPNPFVTNTCRARVIAEDYTFNNEKGGPSTYVYARDGSLQQKEFRRSDGFSAVTAYAYDTDGRLLRSVRKAGDGSESHSSYTYDTLHRLILRIQESGGAIESVESYLYNPDGTLRKAVYQNVDGWITGVLSVVSDDHRRLLKGSFRGSDGSTAELQYTYDGEDCLREIVWRFSSGVFQRYTFTYERRKAEPGAPGT
jgi:hypothetical protein